MRFDWAKMTLLGLVLPLFSHAQDIPNWGVSDEFYRGWTISRCAEKSDLASGAAELPKEFTDVPDFNREKCFAHLRFVLITRHVLFTGGVRKNDEGIMKYSSGPNNLELCTYRISPEVEAIESLLIEAASEALSLPDKEGRDLMMSPKYQPLFKRAVEIHCTSYTS